MKIVFNSNDNKIYIYNFSPIMTNQMKKKDFIVLVGPSGSGKDTLRLRLEKEFGFKNLISTTSRSKRDGEIDGISYNFITKEDFENKINNNEFLEYVNYNGNYYGKNINDIQKLIDNNENIITILEKEGILSILNNKKFFYNNNYDIDIVFLDIIPEIAKERMINRGDDLEKIEERITNDQEYFREIKDLANIIIDAGQSEDIVFDIMSQYLSEK